MKLFWTHILSVVAGFIAGNYIGFLYPWLFKGEYEYTTAGCTVRALSGDLKVNRSGIEEFHDQKTVKLRLVNYSLLPQKASIVVYPHLEGGAAVGLALTGDVSPDKAKTAVDHFVISDVYVGIFQAVNLIISATETGQNALRTIDTVDYCDTQSKEPAVYADYGDVPVKLTKKYTSMAAPKN
jgi:hypothetical protein